MNGHLISLLLALCSGLLGSLQGTINAQIGKAAGQYAMIVGVSLVQAVVAGLFLLRGGWSAFSTVTSPWMIVAGILGVAIMFGVSFAVPAIGTLTVFVLVISGQILASALIDHFGLFSMARPLTPQKIGSILVIILGILWLVKSS